MDRKVSSCQLQTEIFLSYYQLLLYLTECLYSFIIADVYRKIVPYLGET